MTSGVAKINPKAREDFFARLEGLMQEYQLVYDTAVKVRQRARGNLPGLNVISHAAYKAAYVAYLEGEHEVAAALEKIYEKPKAADALKLTKARATEDALLRVINLGTLSDNGFHDTREIIRDLSDADDDKAKKALECIIRHWGIKEVPKKELTGLFKAFRALMARDAKAAAASREAPAIDRPISCFEEAKSLPQALEWLQKQCHLRAGHILRGTSRMMDRPVSITDIQSAISHNENELAVDREMTRRAVPGFFNGDLPGGKVHGKPVELFYLQLLMETLHATWPEIHHACDLYARGQEGGMQAAGAITPQQTTHTARLVSRSAVTRGGRGGGTC